MLGKISLLFNRLSVVLLISVVFLSINQQVLPSIEQIMSKACSDATDETYPNLNFSTYLGGNEGGDDGYGIDVSEDGSCYVTGSTSSSDFPTLNAYNNTYSGIRDAIITKLDGSGSILWSTFFGGSAFDYGYDISIGGDGSCYIIGNTYSSDFPTLNAYNSTYGGNKDLIIAKFSSNGSLLWSTYLGGSELDEGYSIAVASDDSCYVTGFTNSSNFPTKNAYDSTHNAGYIDVFISKFAGNGSLLWSTFLGGSGADWGYGIAVTSESYCYVTGFTGSSDFPTLNAYDATPNGEWDVFVTKFNVSGSLIWSTYLGGTWWDEALSIATTSDGCCYLTGYTVSPDFPTKYAYNSTNGGWGDAFLTKFAANGSLLWSTFLGGNGGDRGHDIAVTSGGSCYVTGETFSSNFPTKNAYNSTLSGGYDAFVTCYSSEGYLHWSTYLGGSGNERAYSLAITEDGGCYVTGRTLSNDFPMQNAYDNIIGGISDAFIVKFVDTPIPATNRKAFYGFFALIAIIPIIALILYKKRK